MTRNMIKRFSYGLFCIMAIQPIFGKGEPTTACVRSLLAPDGSIIKKDILSETTDTDCRKRANELLNTITTTKKCQYKGKNVDAVQWSNANAKPSLIPCKFGSVLGGDAQLAESKPTEEPDDDPYSIKLDKPQKKKIAEAILNPKLKSHQMKFRALQAIASGKSFQDIQKKFKINKKQLKEIIEAYKENSIRGVLGISL